MLIPKLFIHIAAASICVLLVVLLGRQNRKASGGKKDKGYFAFNWGRVENSRKIMQYWRDNDRRLGAVKNIIFLDYLFMLLYSSWFGYSLYVQAMAEQRQWFRYWLYGGMICILLCLITDAVQDYIIYRYVTSISTVQSMQKFTYFKWACLVLGLLPLLVSYIFPFK